MFYILNDTCNPVGNDITEKPVQVTATASTIARGGGNNEDLRKNNRGNTTRTRYTCQYKVEFVDKVNEYLRNSTEEVTIKGYFLNEMKCQFAEAAKKTEQYYKWNKKEEYAKNLKFTLNESITGNVPKKSTKKKMKSPLNSSPPFF